MSVFKDMEWLRYEWTAYRNVTISYRLNVPPGVLLELGMPTYNQLIDRVQRETLAVKNSKQQLANYTTTLNSYLAFIGKTTDSPVGPELSILFEDTCRRYCDSLGLSRRTMLDRRSHLNKWRKAAEALRTEDGSQGPAGSPQSSDFHELLRIAVAQTGQSTKGLAREVEMSFTTLGRWLRGAVPNTRARPSIHRLEKALGMRRGQLSEALSKLDKSSEPAQIEAQPIVYREELASRLKRPYFLPARDFSLELLAEVKTFYEYKTVRRPALKRSKGGKWAVYPSSQRPDQPTVPFAPNTVCVTYGMFTAMLSSYLGYICLAPAEGGMGRTRSEAQTIAWLAVPDAIEGFMTFLKARSNGLTHGGHDRIARQIRSLVQPATGYLTQQPGFAESLPSDVRPEDWDRMCAEARVTVTEWGNDAVDISRDPSDPIAGLLALDDPLEPVIQAVSELDRLALAAPDGGYDEAGHKRDALLLSMLLVNPLRLRNYVSMSIFQNRAGYIYLSGSQYRISIAKAGFKNGKSQGVQNYDVGIPAFLTARIAEYLEVYRTVLVGKNKDVGVLFPSRRSGRTYPKLGRHIHKLTKRLIPGCPGAGPHAFRHLVATVWLTKNPGDYLTVAELLNDRLATVMKHYAHLNKDDSLSRYASQLEGLFKSKGC
jgi:hypothetical protein